ncbi:uncharacterized protein LOC21411464 [Morus notabilis]|uniref:uncharacterized protein LOC21411464 n=1 Tax=Morus notabilis TaxID=981085 RepID=UPI000CECE849|nr:uncharacterized protein LOC21411464 [Morus notabilis]
MKELAPEEANGATDPGPPRGIPKRMSVKPGRDPSFGAFIASMASTTRTKSLEDRVEKQEQQLDQIHSDLDLKFSALSSSLESLCSQFQTWSSSFTTMQSEWEQSRRQSTVVSFPARDRAEPSEGAPGNFGINLKPIRIDVPRFDGSDVYGWTFKIQQYYDYHNASEEQRLPIVPFYFDGKALSWYQWMYKKNQITGWSVLLQALEVRFGPSELEDYQGQLAKLYQTGSVLEYQEAFEDFSNRVQNVPDSFLLSCFISGLRTDIQHEVAAFQPTTLSKAYSLAKLQESKLLLKQRPAKLYSPLPPYYLHQPNHQSSLHPRCPHLNQPPPCPLPNFPHSTLNPRRQSSALPTAKCKSVARRNKCLCYYCDEQYTFGHNCRRSVHILVTPDDTENFSNGDEEPPPAEPPIDMPDTGSETPHISLHAMSGIMTPKTLRFSGLIGNQPLQILVDGGSTHNFIQSRVVSHLNLPISTAKRFDVMVGNGEMLRCEGFCSAVPVKIQQHVFLVDFYVLPVQGGSPHLQGEQAWQPTPVSLHHLRKLQARNSVASFYHLLLIPSESPQLGSDDHPLLAPTLRDFADVFQEPTGLPPHRQLDHHIPLQPNAPPVKVRPYRYPHFQKGEIECLVNEMLAAGIIQPSTSPFSSPVLLVKKKDGTWRFCVDYRALNSITIKDSFPIPTADELMDELHGVEIFSKLDLRAGYH